MKQSGGATKQNLMVETPPTSSGFCSACSRTVTEWSPGPGGRPHASCPHCGALERHRFTALLLRHWPGIVGDNTLDVAPAQCLLELLQGSSNRYVAMDADPTADDRNVSLVASLTKVPLPSRSQHLILCSHVLEHIPDDSAAMVEIGRLLKPGGLALIQVPLRAGEQTEEDFNATPEERAKRFGQSDHVRYYGWDFDHRLRENGLHSVVITPRDFFPQSAISALGLIADEPLWVCWGGRQSAGPVVPVATISRNALGACLCSVLNCGN